MISAAEQVKLLITKGLIISSPGEAEAYLKRIGYYRFKGYALALRDQSVEGKPFHPSTSFEHVARLIELDDQLRLQIFAGIQVLEPALRSCINEVLCAHYGIRWYADSALFRKTPAKPGASKREPFDHEAFLQNCRDAFFRNSTELYVKHYIQNYDVSADPPAWMLAETLTFGIWSHAFQHLTDVVVATEIASRFGLHRKALSSWIHTVSSLRNACAHHARVWNREFGIRPGLQGEAKDYKGVSPLTGNQRIGAQLLVLHLLLRSVRPDHSWLEGIRSLLSNCSPSELRMMGLKPAWHSNPLFLDGRS